MAVSIPLVYGSVFLVTAVTICNNNGIKSSAVPNDLLQLINSKKSGALDGSDNRRSNTATYDSIAEGE